MTAVEPRVVRGQPDILPTPLLPPGFGVPPTRWIHPSVRMRELLRTEPYLFGPGVYDPMGAQLVMHHGFKAVYFSGYSFAIGHLGTTDMDLYSGPEIADGARRTVSALRKYQLTAAVGDPEKGVAPRHFDLPPVIVDMDAGYGNIFNVQRQTELLVNAGVAAAHLEDQVLPKRCGHIGGKALVSASEMIGKLRMMRAVADDLGNPEFVVIARTDGLSAVGAMPGIDGYYVVVTHSGVTLSPFLGRAVAAEIVNGTRAEQLEPFRPGRLMDVDVLRRAVKS